MSSSPLVVASFALTFFATGRTSEYHQGSEDLPGVRWICKCASRIARRDTDYYRAGDASFDRQVEASFATRYHSSSMLLPDGAFTSKTFRQRRLSWTASSQAASLSLVRLPRPT